MSELEKTQIKSIDDVKIGTVLRARLNRDKQRHGEKLWRVYKIEKSDVEEMTMFHIVDNRLRDDEILVTDENVIKRRRFNKLKQNYFLV